MSDLTMTLAPEKEVQVRSMMLELPQIFNGLFKELHRGPRREGVCDLK